MQYLNKTTTVQCNTLKTNNKTRVRKTVVVFNSKDKGVVCLKIAMQYFYEIRIKSLKETE